MRRTLLLFDDATGRGWEPFALTRPAGELLFGALFLRERIERSLGLPAAAYLSTGRLAGFEEEGAPAVLGEAAEPEEAERLILSSRYVPPLPREGGHRPGLGLPDSAPPGGATLWASGEPIGWLLPPDEPIPPEAHLLAPTEGTSGTRARLELPGRLLETPWELLSRNTARIRSDLEVLHPAGAGEGSELLGPLPGVHRIGKHPVSVAPGVRVDPGAVLDSEEGPIHLGPGVRVHAHTHLRGPTVVGPDSTLLGGLIESLACGPACKLAGEISSSVVLGFSNKAHYGYLGISLVGRWVNLGAGTTNSDLKNNYGPIRVETAEGTVDTGLIKLGVLLGDHVKTGIGTLLNSGTSIGAGSNVFGGEMPDRRVPPFTWGGTEASTVHRLEPFLVTAERAMARRDVALTPGLRRFFEQAWEDSRGQEASGRSEGPRESETSG